MNVLDEDIYEVAKKIVYSQYKKASAYRSGALVKKYKELGGRYSEKKTRGKAPLARWFEEEWKNVDPNPTETSYPVYRPTKRVNKKTPLTSDEVDKKNLVEQSKLKQKIRGKKNLPPFKEKK